jgi:hypothetical protein
MKRDPFGTYIETTTLGETVRAFVPPTLPPDPPQWPCRAPADHADALQ